MQKRRAKEGAEREFTATRYHSLLHFSPRFKFLQWNKAKLLFYIYIFSFLFFFFPPKVSHAWKNLLVKKMIESES